METLENKLKPLSGNSIGTFTLQRLFPLKIGNFATQNEGNTFRFIASHSVPSNNNFDI